MAGEGPPPPWTLPAGVIRTDRVDRFVLLAPALVLAGFVVLALGVYAVSCALGRAPELRAVKHNQLFGPFLAGFLVWLIGPLERSLAGRVSPNAITAASVGLCASTGVAAAVGDLPAAVWLYAFAGILDVLDGRIARRRGAATAEGALFDSVSDRWGELLVFGGYAWFLHDSAWVLAVFAGFGASMMVSYTRARAESLGIPLAGGVMQRAERIVLVAAGTLIAAWIGGDAVAPIVSATMLLCAVAASATALGRAVAAYRLLAREVAPPARAAEVVAPVAPVGYAPGRVAKARPLEQH